MHGDPGLAVGSGGRAHACPHGRVRLAGAESLKRLGGGRWQSKDGRFTVEPESGTWVVVDNEQTDELGLPLVRGPFPSLTAARTAIDETRDAAPAESPLADRLERARREPTPRAAPRRPEPEPEPAAPPEPAWLRKLDAGDRKRALQLISRLQKAAVADAESVARAELGDDEPALARVALERRLRAAQDESAPTDAVRAAVGAILDGRDEELGARWRLVDGAGRQIRNLDLTPEPNARPTKRRR